MSVLIAVPCHSGVADSTAIGLFNLGKWLQARGIRHELLTLTNSSLISKVRSRIANVFVHATDFERLLFVDSDIGFRADDFAKLLELDVDMAVAPYSMKTVPPRYNFSLAMRDGQPLPHPRLPAVQVEHIGAGFNLIHRRVFEKVAARHPELRFRPEPASSHRAFTQAEMEKSIHFYETFIDPETRAQVSEDLAFCRRAREAGVEIWMRTDVQLTHAGHFVYRGIDLQAELGGLAAR